MTKDIELITNKEINKIKKGILNINTERLKELTLEYLNSSKDYSRLSTNYLIKKSIIEAELRKRKTFNPIKGKEN